MTRLLLLSVTLAAGLGLTTSVLAAGESATTDVVVTSTKTVVEINDYVEAVDRRLQKGRYDSVEPKENKWLIAQIAALREQLKSADTGSPPSAELHALASEFETGMIKIEEGGIICRQERKTGSHQITQRCFTRKRLQEDTEKSQDQLRNMHRPQSLLPGG